MDLNFVIKVADFGLSEDIYTTNYFRQAQKGEDPPVLSNGWLWRVCQMAFLMRVQMW